MSDFCAFCERYLGGGDFGTCCSVRNDLRYGYDEACTHFKEDYLRKQAFKTGIAMYKAALKNQNPQTNYDRFIRKTPEELAEFFAQQGYKKPVFYDDWLPLCNHVMGAKICHKSGCKDCWLDWLKQEVDHAD